MALDILYSSLSMILEQYIKHNIQFMGATQENLTEVQKINYEFKKQIRSKLINSITE